MSERHIRRLLILGMITEAALAVGALCGLLRLIGRLAEHMPGWTVIPGFVLLFASALWVVFQDCPLFAKKRTICGYRCTI